MEVKESSRDYASELEKENATRSLKIVKVDAELGNEWCVTYRSKCYLAYRCCPRLTKPTVGSKSSGQGKDPKYQVAERKAAYETMRIMGWLSES